MKIGIDIDGVLNSHYDFCINYGSKYCKELGSYHIENMDCFDTTDMFLWEEDIAHQFWDRYREILVSHIPPRLFASEVIKLFKQHHFEIYIITARKNQDEWYPDYLKSQVESLTKKWLTDHQIEYDKIYFNVQNKGTFCKNHSIDFMVDDEPKNIRNLVDNTSVIIFDAPYNRHPDFSSLLRAYSWYDLYHKIMNCEVIKK